MESAKEKFETATNIAKQMLELKAMARKEAIAQLKAAKEKATVSLFEVQTRAISAMRAEIDYVQAQLNLSDVSAATPPFNEVCMNLVKLMSYASELFSNDFKSAYWNTMAMASFNVSAPEPDISQLKLSNDMEMVKEKRDTVHAGLLERKFLPIKPNGLDFSSLEYTKQLANGMSLGVEIVGNRNGEIITINIEQVCITDKTGDFHIFGRDHFNVPFPGAFMNLDAIINRCSKPDWKVSEQGLL